MTETQTLESTAVLQFVSPDVYHLSGGGISISYQPFFAGDQPSLTYQDQYRTETFRGDAIRSVEVPDFGTVISVTLTRTVDVGSTTLSVVLPDVALPTNIGASAPLSTVCITTLHRMQDAPGLVLGQREVYTVTPVAGLAALVRAPLERHRRHHHSWAHQQKPESGGQRA